MSNLVFPLSIVNGRPHSSSTPIIDTINDSNLSKYVVRFQDGVTNNLHFVLPVTSNYLSGTATLRVRWKASAASGSVRWQVAYSSYSNTNTANLSPTDVFATSATAGADLINEATFSLTVGASRINLITLTRLGADGSDTLSGNVDLLQMELEYAIDPTVARVFMWVPANAMTIPASSGATLGTETDLGTHFPWVLTMRNSQNDYADFDFIVPSNFYNNLKFSILDHFPGIGTGAVVWRIDTATTTVGNTVDPSFTTGTATAGNSNFGSIAGVLGYLTAVNAPSTIAANQRVTARVTREGSHGSDTSSVTNHSLLGVVVQYDALLRSPGLVNFDPGSGSTPTVSGASIVKIDGTSGASYWVGQYAAGSNTCIDYINMMPYIYSAGGTLKVKWTSNAPSGTAVFRVDYGTPTVGDSMDPVLAASASALLSTTAGSGIINEFTTSIASGMVAGDEIYLRIWRLGAHGSETMTSHSLNIIDISLESTVAA